MTERKDIFCRIYPKTSPHWIGLKNSIRTTHVSILIPKAQLDKAPNIGVLLFFLSSIEIFRNISSFVTRKKWESRGLGITYIVIRNHNKNKQE